MDCFALVLTYFKCILVLNDVLERIAVNTLSVV
jgi:hypothetical protein